MARKVVIGDLVVKVGVDSKSASAEMTRLHKKFRSHDKALLDNSKRVQASEVKTNKYIDTRYKKNEEERKRVVRHEERLQRIRNRQGGLNGGTRSRSGLSGGARVAGVFGAAYAASQVATGSFGIIMDSMAQLVKARSSDNIHRIALRSRGLGDDEIEKRREKVYRQSLNYGADPAEVLRVIGDFAATTEMSVDSLEKFGVAAAALGTVYNIGAKNMSSFFTGSRQFFSGAMDWDNVKQLFENVGISLDVLAKSFGLTTAEFTKKGQGGEIKNLVAQQGGVQAVWEKFVQQMMETSIPAFELTRGEVTTAEQFNTNEINEAKKRFAAAYEDSYIKYLWKMTETLKENGEIIDYAGNLVSDAFDSIISGIDKFFAYIEELKKLYNENEGFLGGAAVVSKVATDAVALGYEESPAGKVDNFLSTMLNDYVQQDREDRRVIEETQAIRNQNLNNPNNEVKVNVTGRGMVSLDVYDSEGNLIGEGQVQTDMSSNVAE